MFLGGHGYYRLNYTSRGRWWYSGGMDSDRFIRPLNPALEDRIRRNPSLNIDTFIVPSPFIIDRVLEKDHEHSYVWDEEGELLGYCLVYASPDRSRFHIYKQVTSPFGRGKGIGSAFLARLVRELPPDALVYLFVWEKQSETQLFFANKGFEVTDHIVYRNLVFTHMSARAGELKPGPEKLEAAASRSEDLGRTRHDARKTLRLLSDMVGMLSVENCTRIIEDINRETTALVNLLNAYRDTVEYYHEVDLKELIFERIIPFIEHSNLPCEVRLELSPGSGTAWAHYLDVGRALVNLASNSLDAIREAGRPGLIQISLSGDEESVQLRIEDNGSGIEAERLAAGGDGLPLFVGRTTKGRAAGEGLGTRQVFAAFGSENVQVESERGRFTRWTIRLSRKPLKDTSPLRSLEERWREFHELSEFPDLRNERDRSRLASFIWQTRKMEILSWDLLMPFSRHNNIREIFRGILACLHGGRSIEALGEELTGYRVDEPGVGGWLLDLVRMIKRNEQALAEHTRFDDFAGMHFRSYGQAPGKTVIFTIDPESGRFLAADRKLAEHLDFVPYLAKEREELLRGELNGDVKNVENPIMLGVWTIKDGPDALAKLRLVRTGCARLVEMTVPAEKRLAFYQSTFNQGPQELNTFLTPTIGELAVCPDAELERYLTATDEESYPSSAAD